MSLHRTTIPVIVDDDDDDDDDFVRPSRSSATRGRIVIDDDGDDGTPARTALMETVMVLIAICRLYVTCPPP